MKSPPLVFLVTGCSTGIGRATAALAAERGHRVFAGARRLESLDGLPGNVERLSLDVTRRETIDFAVKEIVSQAGRIDVLVNNAGYGQMGTVEDVPLEKWKAEYEVNVFGLVAMTQAVLPLMRKQKSGTIVNIGSIAGLISYPFGGAYCSSKFAVEAISDALRLEVERFGIRVVLIEAGPITTRFNDRVEQEVDSLVRNAASGYHAEYERAFARFRKESTAGALPAGEVARVVLKAVSKRRPRARYLVTIPARLGAIGKRFLPGSLIDSLMRGKFR
jgi:NAD(P)-dependent dehydrogenase (short-subunit alcohol dehydrogenase family)